MAVSKIVKYVLFATNFLIFVMSLLVLGSSIYALVNKMAFLSFLNQVDDWIPKDIISVFSELITSAAVLFLVVSLLSTIIAFLGCYGAYAENRCMLATYFVLILGMLVAMVVGVVLAGGDIKGTLKKPLEESLKAYNENLSSNNASAEGIVTVIFWNKMQEQFGCCGVSGASDWEELGNFPTEGLDLDKDALEALAEKLEIKIPDLGGLPNMVDGARVPEGCCHYRGTENIFGENGDNDAVKECRKSDPAAENTPYNFEGCFTILEDKFEANQRTVMAVGGGVIALMFLNMLLSFAMCTMVEQ